MPPAPEHLVAPCRNVGRSHLSAAAMTSRRVVDQLLGHMGNVVRTINFPYRKGERRAAVTQYEHLHVRRARKKGLLESIFFLKIYYL